ncbi:MAG: aldose 1-epimerase family protein [Oscillospiraceae bacterium]
MGFRDDRKYLGNSKQLFRVDDYRLTGGRGDGMRMLEVHNGADMEFVCSADRCMDIHYLRCRGNNLGFMTCAGDVSPQYYDSRGFGWMRSFTAGFMTTCGLLNTGLPEEYGGRERGLHGRASNTPAENVGVIIDETEEGIGARLCGTVREAYPTGENLELTRTVSAAYGDPCIRIHDVVRNRGVGESLHMMLYHFNLGYPLLSENTRLLIPTKKVTPRDSDAAANPEAWKVVTPPEKGLPEMCYYHELKAAPDGRTFVAAYNPAVSAGVAIHFDRGVLDHFVQWRQLTTGYYAMGLEPCNATIDGISDALKNGSAKFLRPGESVTYDITIELLGGQERFDGLLEECEKLS